MSKTKTIEFEPLEWKRFYKQGILNYYCYIEMFCTHWTIRRLYTGWEYTYSLYRDNDRVQGFDRLREAKAVAALMEGRGR